MYEYIKILLVEDEAPLLGAMTVKLKKAGFTVLQGHNGREGLELAMKEFPNIIITDIVMPEMDGLQMIQNIRKDQQWGASVPIILLTNLNEFNHVATAMEYGVHDYLVKSNWKLKDLLETVKNKLNLAQEAGLPAQSQGANTIAPAVNVAPANPQQPTQATVTTPPVPTAQVAPADQSQPVPNPNPSTTAPVDPNTIPEQPKSEPYYS